MPGEECRFDYCREAFDKLMGGMKTFPPQVAASHILGYICISAKHMDGMRKCTRSPLPHLCIAIMEWPVSDS